MNPPYESGVFDAWRRAFGVRGRVWICVLFSLLPFLAASATPPDRDTLLIKGGNLIDGTGRPRVRNVWILIENGSIARVGKAGSFPRPREARILRAGVTVLPGLIDAHVHIFSSGVVGFSFHYPQLRGYKVSLRNLRSELLGGVTLVRDLNIPLPQAHRLSDAVKDDPSQGARLIYAGPILAAKDGYGSPYSNSVTTPQEGRSRVRELVQEGVGVIKVAVTGRDFAGNTLKVLAPEVLVGIVEEAHAHGLPVAAHVAGATVDDLRIAVEAGVDSLEHMPGGAGPLDMPDTLYSESGLLPEIRRRGITIVPTLSVEACEDFGPTLPELWDDPALLLKLDLDQREALARNVEDFSYNPRRQATARAGSRRLEIFLQEVRKIHDAGVRIGAGTDAGNGLTFHGNLFTEIEYLTQGGLTPMEAIVTATRGNAELLRVLEEAGTVEQGKRADLLLVRGDPLEDLGALRHVDKVIISGRVVEVQELLKNAIRQERKRARSGGSPP